MIAGVRRVLSLTLLPESSSRRSKSHPADTTVPSFHWRKIWGTAMLHDKYAPSHNMMQYYPQDDRGYDAKALPPGPTTIRICIARPRPTRVRVLRGHRHLATPPPPRSRSPCFSLAIPSLHAARTHRLPTPRIRVFNPPVRLSPSASGSLRVRAFRSARDRSSICCMFIARVYLDWTPEPVDSIFHKLLGLNAYAWRIYTCKKDRSCGTHRVILSPALSIVLIRLSAETGTTYRTAGFDVGLPTFLYPSR